MIIHQNFTGGNIRIEKQEGNTFYLNNQLRDTTEDWFYWAFCIEAAGGKTVTFKFPPVRLGYYGPAVSHDLKKWDWLGKGDDENSFTYTFGENENKVYFAHSMLYHPDRFYEFAKRNGIEIKELCKSGKGRSVPYITIGNGKNIVLLTARHHACESTGSYVLEGVLQELITRQLEDSSVICVPFVDFDGVIEGDQGKSRFPYDHNRDYNIGQESIYPEIKAIRNIADKGILYGFDFHSPWHFNGGNDNVFIVEKRPHKKAEYDRFGMILENLITEKSMKYSLKNNVPPDQGWNSSKAPCFGCYMNDIGKAKIAFTLETAYFGTEDNIFTQDRAVELGKCFALAIKKYDKDTI